MPPPRITTAILCSTAVLWLAPPLCAADERLRPVIENVRANEPLYQNIEAHVTASYQLQDLDPGNVPGLIKSQSETARTVLQGHLLYFRSDQVDQLGDNTTMPNNLEMGYDGEYTRRVHGQVANLVHGPDSHDRLFRPHTWLLAGARVTFPLSVWLAGGKELRTYPEAGPYKRLWAQETFYEQEEVVDGLHTVKLRAETRDPSSRELITLRYLWLATDRNYLPIKTEAYQANASTTLPVELGRAEDFREVAPGVWLPFRRSFVVHSDAKLRENKLVVSNSREATLTKIDLNPRYDISLFQDIPIPDGTKVYEVKDGKIINSYTQGEQTSPLWHPAKARPWWRWLVAPSVGLVLIGGWFAYRWRARRPGRAPGAA
jgi:hypothetical protein